MRRGMMEWQAEEVPAALLSQRIQAVAEHCRQQGLSAMFFYSNFTRPVDISTLTHFVPFWSQALLAVTADGQSAIAMATTGRTVQWIRSSSVVDHVLVSSQIGHALADWALQVIPQNTAQAIGVVHPSDIPALLLKQIQSRLPTYERVDESAWWAHAASSWDAPELVQAKVRSIARQAFTALEATYIEDAHTIVAVTDGFCRAQGAEEVSVYIAPSVNTSTKLHRIEGPVTLGDQVTVQISLAYKGHWIRQTRTYTLVDQRLIVHPLCSSAETALSPMTTVQEITCWAQQIAQNTQSQLKHWRIEGPKNGMPLANLISADSSNAVFASPPSHACLTLHLETSNGPVIWGGPLPVAH